MASQSLRGNCDDDLQAYYSTALSYPAVQGHGFVSTQPWRERKFVEDSEASDETQETQELPGRQTELDPDLPPEVLENQLDFASTRPVFDNHLLDYQSRFTSTPPYNLSFSRRPQAQPIEQSGAASQVSDPTQHDPNLQLQPIVRSTPALSARLDSQETQFSITPSLVPRESPLNQRETVETVPISQPFRLNKYPDFRFAFNAIGRLARDASWITMDDGATQQATLPPTAPYAQKFTLNDFDRTDILCILIPTTPTAYQAVELVEESASQHILHRPGKLSPLKATTPTDNMVADNDAPTNKKAKPSMEIALRMSSYLLNPALGFTFGRNKLASDLRISKDAQMKVSGRHFRIYVNSKGSLMCQDVSTNGTVVDSVSLRPKQSPTDWGDQMTLHHGSVIEILINNDLETMRFMVQVPDRSGVSQLYGSKLDQYIDFIEQMERRLQEEKNRKTQGVPTDLGLAPVPQFSHILRADKLSTRANKVLVAGTEPFNHGMQWNGGDIYHTTALLGKGAFASVYKLTRRADGELFAAKEIRKTVFAQRGVLDRRVEQELNIMKQLEHPNIVQYIDHHETPENLYILMELVPHGDLQSILQTRHVLTEFHCQAIASQMCQALKYLHDRDITHRDIKPDNILIQSNDPYVFKLSDFGLSKVVKNNETFLTSFCGTYLYCAPEVYPGYHHYNDANDKPERKRRSAKDGRRSKPRAKLPYTTAVDTWSIAAVLYHLLCGFPPYTGTTENYGAVILENIMNNPVNYSRLRVVGVSQDAINFLEQMLVIEPSLRMSDVDCLEHPWLIPDKKPTEVSEDLEYLTQVAARIDDFSTRDTERAEDDGNLFEFQQLASQLSIKNKANEQDSRNMEEPPSEDLEEIEEMVEGAGQFKRNFQGQDDLDSFDEYVDQYPSTSQIRRAQQAAANNNHLFGQISPAALRSSGALGREARRALEMPSHARAGMDDDESHYEGSSQFSAIDYPNVQDQPPPRQSRYLDSGEAAPSLLGAEAMVNHLHMDSTMADVSVSEFDRQAGALNAEGANEQTSQRAFEKSQSVHSDDYLYEATPPRSRRRLDEPSASMRESKRVKTHHETVDASEVDPYIKSAKAIAPQSGNDEQPATTSIITAEQNVTESSAADPPSKAPNQQGMTSTTHPKTTPTPSSPPTKADSNAAPTVTPPAVTSEPDPTSTTPANFAPPPPPGPITYGTLTPTASSLPFKPIKLKQRVTTFGRHPACNYTWPNGLDTRVPKFALDIAFWRPRIERSLVKHPNLRWQNEKELRTIIATRTSSAIFVNGVALTKKPDGEKGLRYGVLKTGDMVTVFDDKGKEGKGEKLEFRVDIRIGKSKGKRKEGEVFEIVKEEPEDGKGVDAGSSYGSAAPEGQAVDGAPEHEKQGDGQRSQSGPDLAPTPTGPTMAATNK